MKLTIDDIIPTATDLKHYLPAFCGGVNAPNDMEKVFYAVLSVYMYKVASNSKEKLPELLKNWGDMNGDYVVRLSEIKQFLGSSMSEDVILAVIESLRVSDINVDTHDKFNRGFCKKCWQDNLNTPLVGCSWFETDGDNDKRFVFSGFMFYTIKTITEFLRDNNLIETSELK